MFDLKKYVVVVKIGSILFGLTGCNSNGDIVVTADLNTFAEVVEYNKGINLCDLEFTYPKGWTKRGNEKEIFFDDESKKTVGGVILVGYYGDYLTTLPNHSEILNIENIDTALGKGKLITLERDHPAAAGNNEIWTEIHAIIPVNKTNLAYDIWVRGTEDMLLSILKSIHFEKVN